MKSNKLIVLISLFLVRITLSLAQNVTEKGYFLFPINPGKVNYLAANMGELRSNHFHGGIDVKTEGQIGYNVYASAEGYVDRIKVSSYGYGNTIYIRHPNNLVTVYAHLDKFNIAIGDYIRKKQYENQSFDIDIYLNKNELPIIKGEVIGLSGNSGSSQGPHLHYEIRDTTDRIFNPSNFGFAEIQDNISPIFDKIAITTFNLISRVNDGFGRLEFKPIKTGSIYTMPKVYAFGLIGLELKAYDKKNGVHNTFGINTIQVFVDNKEIFEHDMNSFTFDETRHINTHVNYPLYITTGKWFERLYVADGNVLSSYTTDASRGKIFINSDNANHRVKIKITDDFKNESTLEFDIQGRMPVTKNIHLTSIPNQTLSTEIFENVLKVSTKCVGDPGAKLFFKGTSTDFVPSYSKSGMVVYLYDLRKGLPDSIKVGTQKEIFNFVKMISPIRDQQINFDGISLSIPANSLTDTIYLEYKKELTNKGEVFHIHNKTVSLFDSITIGITPPQNIVNKSKTHVYSANKGKMLFEGGEWIGNKIEVKTKILGKFILAEDTIKPSISLISNYGNSIKFDIADNLSGIKSYKASLDGYWILMNYDHKRRLLWSERLNKTVPLKGKFKLEVIDNAGNINEFIINL